MARSTLRTHAPARCGPICPSFRSRARRSRSCGEAAPTQADPSPYAGARRACRGARATTGCPRARTRSSCRRKASGARPAGLGRRAAAGVADLLLLGTIDGLIVALTARLLGMPITGAADLPWPPLAAFLLLFDLAAIATLTALGGQTLGKMAAGIRVVGLDGGPVPVSRAVARTVLSVLSALPAGLGFVGSLARSRRAGHDWLAGTRVVRAVP
ncbi:MAG: RDD family protein [Acidobacteria bacterium]|nr:RDD family protein [Acidobacteriota bacterium]